VTEPRCAAISAALDEPQAGTASTASAWICLEQPGPWGRDALTDSRLDPDLGAELGRRAAHAGARVLLIRRPGRHPDTDAPTRRVYIAATTPGAARLERADVRPEDLLELDFAALAAGRPTGFGTPVADPLLLVCANSRRDTCCALLGRPLAHELAAARPADTVWECSHTGGHRFAPTAVLLPTGYTYGRLDTAFAARLLDEAAAGRVVAERCRGRSAFSPAGQVAELAVRELTGEGRDTLTADPAGTVRHADGRSWRVRLGTRTLPARPASCGAEPAVASVAVATGVEPLIPVP
jgi:hypothetical protein